MSRQSCLDLCRDRVYFKLRQRFSGHEVYIATVRRCVASRQGGAHTTGMLGHDSRVFLATRLGVHDRGALSR